MMIGCMDDSEPATDNAGNSQECPSAISDVSAGRMTTESEHCTLKAKALLNDHSEMFMGEVAAVGALPIAESSLDSLMQDSSEIMETESGNDKDSHPDIPGILLYKPLGLVICKACNVALSPCDGFQFVQNHMHVEHQVVIYDHFSETYVDFYKQHYRSSSTLQRHAELAKFNPVPNMNCYDGVQCSLCSFVSKASQSDSIMRQHMKDNHKFANWNSFIHTLEPALVQSFFRSSKLFRVYAVDKIGDNPLVINETDTYDANNLEPGNENKIAAKTAQSTMMSNQSEINLKWGNNLNTISTTWFPSTPVKSTDAKFVSPGNSPKRAAPKAPKAAAANASIGTLLKAHLAVHKPLGIDF
jgi:Orsellinic acid/F9775 biosynthesis cluster protein D